MAYRLEAGERISVGMRRVLLEQVNQIRADLTYHEMGRDEGVHDARKNCKRVRAAYRLIRDEIGDGFYRQENIRFRDTARLLAGARDSWVMIQALDKLAAAHEDRLRPQACEGIRQALTDQYETTLAQERENQTLLPGILVDLERARVKIEDNPLAIEDFSVFRSGIRRVYSRGRRAMDRAYTELEAGIFHEWRKQVKYLWHTLEILEGLWPNVLFQVAAELHTLSEYLGEDHDLAVLRSTAMGLPASFITEQELLFLVQLIDQERLRLEGLARPLGERLYFEPPNDFMRRLEAYWRAWQSEVEERQGEWIQVLQERSPVYVPPVKGLWTTSEMAAGLGISAQQVRQLIYDRKLPAEKVGAIWVIRNETPGVGDPVQGDERRVLRGLVSTLGAGAHLQIPPEKVRKLIQAGELRAAKIGRQWVILEQDLINFKAQGE